jgi:hypothetical protein
MTKKETSRLVVRVYLGIGVLFILFGFGQFAVFLGLDEIGVVEVGNALGHGLLLWIAVAIGLFLLMLGLLLAVLLRKEIEGGPRVAGSPFQSEREDQHKKMDEMTC